MNRCILIAEDDTRNMKLVRDLLALRDYPTLEARDGLEAVRIAREQNPALILMDIQMPVMDGLQATAILKADRETSHIPIVALTSYAMAEDAKKIREAGCDQHIAKPFDIHVFLAAVDAYFAEPGNPAK